jgi:hypothetical protein
MDEETLQQIEHIKTRHQARTHKRGQGDGTVTVSTLLDHDIATLLRILKEYRGEQEITQHHH